MCTNLAKRGATYYFRRIIPAELRPAFDGRREFMESLRTKDRETAKRLIPERRMATDRLLDTARRLYPENRPETAPSRATERAGHVEWEMLQASLEAAHSAEREQEAREARYDDREPLRKRLERAFAKSTAEITPLEAAARDLLRAAGVSLTPTEEAEVSETVRLAEHRRGVMPRILSKAAGERPAEAATQIPAPAPAEPSGVMLEPEIVDRWAAERKPVQKGIDTHRAVARWFYERVGRKPVDAVTRRDVLAFKDKLLAEGQSAANVIMKLSRLRTLLQWAADNELATGNPATGVTVLDTERARNRRLEFDLDALRRIFASPVYSGGARPAGGRGEAAYWLPLLALFTGARLEELGQLRPDDVQELAYPDGEGVERRTWFIRIREDATDKLRLKNAASERDVPVHPELERLGFLQYVAAMRGAGEARLFPRLRPNVYGRLTAKWGEWFGPYLRNVCGLTDKRLVFHSFRHTFKQYARHAGIEEGVQRQIMGHSSTDVADEYGSGYPLHRVVEGIGRYRVPGLALPLSPLSD